jgi:DNA-binding SARP family transcriptional activator/DNA-binding beta-propeller fold protein YncE
MEFRILGALEVVEDGRALDVGGPRQRAVLAILALHANQVVSRDRLIDELWRESPPATAQTALQVHVSQLRKALGADRIETRTPGYRLRIEPDELDVVRFEQLVTKARRASAADAGDQLRQALDIWRGPPLADLDDALARPERARLEEERMSAHELRITADLDLGRHEDLIPELEGLVQEHPLRERLRAQLMVALYRSGRQADALEVYREGRRLLDQELGLQPGDELRQLERAILEQDPALAPSATEQKAASRLLARSEAAAIPADSVALVDHEEARVVGHVLVGRRPVAVVVGHGSVWVANADDGTVSRIDPDRREVIRTIGIGAPAIDLAVGPDAVWVANGSDGTVSRIDPDADAVVDTINLRGSSELAWNPTYAVEVGDDSIWVAVGPRHVVRIDPATTRVAATIDVGDVPLSVAFGEGALWAVTIAERALRIEPGTNAATMEVPIGYPVALTAGENAIWVSDARGQIWRIDSATAAVSQTTPVGRGLVGLCAAGGAVWVANNAEGWVARIDPADGQVAGHVMVGHAPTDVALENGTVWVSIQRESAI